MFTLWLFHRRNETATAVDVVGLGSIVSEESQDYIGVGGVVPNDRYINEQMRTCRHFTGIQHEVCKAGLRYDDVRDDSRKALDRFPCLGGGSSCDKRDFYTRDEAEAKQAEWTQRFTNVVVARDAIVKAEGKKRGVSGSVPCPICATGSLHYSIASLNGHIHGQCSTDGCVSWME